MNEGKLKFETKLSQLSLFIQTKNLNGMKIKNVKLDMKVLQMLKGSTKSTKLSLVTLKLRLLSIVHQSMVIGVIMKKQERTVLKHVSDNQKELVPILNQDMEEMNVKETQSSMNNVMEVNAMPMDALNIGLGTWKTP